jgi:hypothetical protein
MGWVISSFELTLLGGAAKCAYDAAHGRSPGVNWTSAILLVAVVAFVYAMSH